MKAVGLPLLAVLVIGFSSCGETSPEAQEKAEQSESLTAEEKTIQAAARPFLEALAGGDYAAAYNELSSHARARMSESQFLPPADEATHAKNEKNAVANASVRDFQLFAAKAANEYGRPSKLISAGEIETDAKILAGNGDAIDTAFTIGLMPGSIPVEIRKGAVRAQLGVTLLSSQIQKIADQQGISVEELEKSGDFAPYCNLKVVMVDEDGALKVGYFEFTSPSLWD